MNVEATIINFLKNRAVNPPTGFSVYGRRIPGNESLWPCAMIALSPGGEYDRESGEHTAQFDLICFGATVAERDEVYQSLKALDGFWGNTSLGFTVETCDEIDPGSAAEYVISEEKAWDAIKSTWRITLF